MHAYMHWQLVIQVYLQLQQALYHAIWVSKHVLGFTFHWSSVGSTPVGLCAHACSSCIAQTLVSLTPDEYHCNNV